MGHLHFDIYRETFVLFYLIFYFYANASITGFHKGMKWKSSFIKDTHYISTILYFIFYILSNMMFMFTRGIVNHGTHISIYSWYDKHGTVMILNPKHRKILDPCLHLILMYLNQYITYCFQCSFSHCWK